MREIKFRAWGTKTKVMYCEAVPVLSTPIGDGRIYAKSDSAFCNGIFIKYGVLMQYTGLKDKNDKEIFEGDILGGIIGGYVVWIDKQARFGIDICGETNECRFEEFEQNDLEVIGNIYENKNLLEANE